MRVEHAEVLAHCSPQVCHDKDAFLRPRIGIDRPASIRTPVRYLLV